jgi:hypothetical protein
MSDAEYKPPFAFSLQEELTQIEHDQQLAREASRDYRAIRELTDHPVDELITMESRMASCRRSSFLMDTASCAADIALHPDAEYEHGREDREKRLEIAAGYWKTVFHREIDKPNDLAELAKWNLSQLPTFRGVIRFIEDPGCRAGVYREQEANFKDYFTFILDRWDKEVLDGHALESLTSYFAHRSNKLRPGEYPMFTTASPIRDDHHAEAERRVDVDLYYLPQATKYGLQVKGGKLRDPYANRPVRYRIFFSDARRALCIPTTEKSLKRTMQAIVSGAPEHRQTLDTIAADHRARLYREIQEARLVGTRMLRRDIQR